MNPKNELSREYIDSLEDFWGGRRQTSIEHLTKALADDPDRADLLCLYRLWVEVLAEQSDEAALKSLLKHLEVMTSEQKQHAGGFGAIRGLICLELGRVEEAELYSKTAKGTSGKPYRAELNIRLRHLRGDFCYHSDHDSLIRSFDYFHLRLLASTHFYHKNQKKMDSLFDKINGFFPTAPVGEYFGYHQAYEAGDLNVALTEASKLLEKYPANLNFHIYKIYSLYSLGRVDEAMNELEEALEVHGDTDPDLVGIAAGMFDMMSEEYDDPELFEKAYVYHSRAIALFSKLGLPAYESQEFISLINQNAEAEDEELASGDIVPPKVWIYNTDARQYSRLLTSDENSVDKLYVSMNHQAVAGDICVLVNHLSKTSESSEGPKWKIGGIYAVGSDPLWDPMDGYKNSLELLLKPEPSIEFLVDSVGEGDIKGESVLMDDQTVEVFIESLREYRSSFDVNVEAFEKLESLVSA